MILYLNYVHEKEAVGIYRRDRNVVKRRRTNQHSVKQEKNEWKPREKRVRVPSTVSYLVKTQARLGIYSHLGKYQIKPRREM